MVRYSDGKDPVSHVEMALWTSRSYRSIFDGSDSSARSVAKPWAFASNSSVIIKHNMREYVSENVHNDSDLGMYHGIFLNSTPQATAYLAQFVRVGS